MLDRLCDFLEPYHPRYICLGCLAKATDVARATLGVTLDSLHSAGKIEATEAECLGCFTRGAAFRVTHGAPTR